MAEISKELQAKLDEAEKLKADNKKLKDTNAKLKVVAIENKVSVEIDGTFQAQAFDEATGETVEKTFKFKDGFPTARLDDGQSTIVYSEMLIKVANGEELTETDFAKCPQAKSMTRAIAVKTLQKLVDLEASFVELV